MTNQNSTAEQADPQRRVTSIRLIEGMNVESADGELLELADVVIDPVRRRVTHMVVQPPACHDEARLVPIDAIASCDDPVVLSWSSDEVDHAERVAPTDFVEFDNWQMSDDGWDLFASRILAWPYYGATSDKGRAIQPATRGRASRTTTAYDRIPAGEAEIRRLSEVVSADDHIVGTVDGFVIDPDDELTHLILEHGHLWGRREITIPMREVDSVISDRVHLRATRDEVGGFPTVEFHRHGAGDTQATSGDVTHEGR